MLTCQAIPRARTGDAATIRNGASLRSRTTNVSDGRARLKGGSPFKARYHLTGQRPHGSLGNSRELLLRRTRTPRARADTPDHPLDRAVPNLSPREDARHTRSRHAHARTGAAHANRPSVTSQYRQRVDARRSTRWYERR